MARYFMHDGVVFFMWGIVICAMLVSCGRSGDDRAMRILLPNDLEGLVLIYKCYTPAIDGATAGPDKHDVIEFQISENGNLCLADVSFFYKWHRVEDALRDNGAVIPFRTGPTFASNSYAVWQLQNVRKDVWAFWVGAEREAARLNDDKELLRREIEKQLGPIPEGGKTGQSRNL